MNNPKKRKNIHLRPSFSELLSRYCDIPSDIFGGMTLELRGRNELLLCGCREILEYSECRIVVVASCTVEVRGRRLSMSSFSEGRIVICGEVDAIDLCGGKRDEEK